MNTMRADIFDRLSFLSLLLVVASLPFFFLPFSNISIETSKSLLLVTGLVFSIIFWSLARFFDGKIILPKSLCLLGGAGIVLVFFLSALFSGAPQASFFGTMMDVGTFWFIFSGFLLMLMSSIIFRNPQNAKIVLFGAILSSAFILIFQSARLFIPEVLSLGILSGKTGNVLGSWNAFGLFAGFSGLMSLLVVEFFVTTRAEKWILRALVILSLILVAAVNFTLVWGLLGISSLIIFVYKVSITSNQGHEEGKSHFPTFSFGIIMVTLLFFMSRGFIGGVLPNRLGLFNNEIGPSFSSTMLVTKSVLKKSPLFGLGPNKFGQAWASFKPATINSTQFWDVFFSSGSGLLPTLVSTTGYLGILSWLLFFFLFIGSGLKSIFSSIKNGVNWETMAFFVLSLYLFIASFFYSTGPVIFLLALALAGVFVGLSAGSRPDGEISISFLNDHKKGFFSIFFLVLLIIASAALSFKYAERLASVSYFGKALTASTVPAAEVSINKALTLHINDSYLRAYAQIYLVKLNSLAQKRTPLSDAEKVDLQTSLDQAVGGAQRAIVYDPTNYQNFQTLGSVYQVAASLRVKDAYSKTVETYKMASALSPLNPGLKLALARAALTDGKIKEAKEYGGAALSLKPDYLDALVVLSQIAQSGDDEAGALFYAQTALSLSPENEDLIKYVNSLKSSGSSNTASTPGAADTTKNNSPTEE